MANGLDFFVQFVRNPSTVGAVAPSSRGLACRMLEGVDFDQVSTIVELGPGTGVFSREVLRRKRADTTFFALELNETMCDHLAADLPELTVYNDSASAIGKYLAQHGKDHADVIISGLPWAAFKSELQSELLDATVTALAEGGLFATFAYLQGLVLPAGLRFAKRLDSSFAQVERSKVVWRNLPPALVYRCRR
ncbi:MAG: hypothetical protein JW936_06270 [Sedimentisphaerales bacterium]|nr:hypothetical protein [Sedimentisphaerales bacterium]